MGLGGGGGVDWVVGFGCWVRFSASSFRYLSFGCFRWLLLKLTDMIVWQDCSSYCCVWGLRGVLLLLSA